MSAVHLRHFDGQHLAELMSWFPDAPSCRMWGGPEFRFPFTEATFREDARLGDLASYVLVADGRLVGFGQYYRRLGHCQLGRLAIAPGLRGRGLGSTLVRELAARGRNELGGGPLSLFVLDGNERALRLYRRLGFHEARYPEPFPGLEGCAYLVASELAP